MSARAAAALLLVAGCTRPVEQLRLANEDLAAGRLPALEARIAEGYRDAVGGKAELRDGLEELLRGATGLEIRTPELTALRTEGPDRGTTLQGKLELSFEDKERGGWTLTGPLDVELDHSGQIRSGYLADLRDLVGLREHAGGDDNRAIGERDGAALRDLRGRRADGDAGCVDALRRGRGGGRPSNRLRGGIDIGWARWAVHGQATHDQAQYQDRAADNQC